MTYSSKELEANGVDSMILALRKVRRHYGLRQFELAAMLGIDESTLCKLETGKRLITVPMRLRLAGFVSRWDPERGAYMPPAERKRRVRK